MARGNGNYISFRKPKEMVPLQNNNNAAGHIYSNMSIGNGSTFVDNLYFGRPQPSQQPMPKYSLNFAKAARNQG